VSFHRSDVLDDTTCRERGLRLYYALARRGAFTARLPLRRGGGASGVVLAPLHIRDRQGKSPDAGRMSVVLSRSAQQATKPGPIGGKRSAKRYRGLIPNRLDRVVNGRPRQREYGRELRPDKTGMVLGAHYQHHEAAMGRSWPLSASNRLFFAGSLRLRREGSGYAHWSRTSPDN